MKKDLYEIQLLHCVRCTLQLGTVFYTYFKVDGALRRVGSEND